MVSINDVLNKKNTKSKFEKTTFRPWENVFIPDHQENSENVKEVTNITPYINEESKNLKNPQPLLDVTFRKESFIGNTLSVIKYIIDKEESRDSHYSYSKSMSNIDIAQHCKTSVLAVKMIITRLKKKNILQIVHGKRGRGGFSIYSIPLKVVNIILA